MSLDSIKNTPEGTISTVDYIPKPETTEPVPKESCVTRIRDEGCRRIKRLQSHYCPINGQLEFRGRQGSNCPAGLLDCHQENSYGDAPIEQELRSADPRYSRRGYRRIARAKVCFHQWPKRPAQARLQDISVYFSL